jgi:hypothetical protein
LIDGAGELAGRGDRIGRVMRARGVSSASAHDDVDFAAERGERTRAKTDPPGRAFGIDVQRDDGTHTVDRACRDHFAAAVGALFRRLEHSTPGYRPRQRRARFVQREQRTHHARCVRVMSARVCDAVDLRAIGHLLLVLQAQRIDVGAQCYAQRRARRAVAGLDDHPPVARRHGDFQAGFAQQLGEVPRRLDFRAARLRPRMEPPAHCYQPLDRCVDVGVDTKAPIHRSPCQVTPRSGGAGLMVVDRVREE